MTPAGDINGPLLVTQQVRHGRPPKNHAQGPSVLSFVACYIYVSECVAQHPAVGDILSGTLALKTAGDSSSRGLSRRTLFHVLQRCPSITVEAVAAATNGRYSDRSVQGYAAVARVASKALQRYLGTLPEPVKGAQKTLLQEREDLDAPYQAELRALGLG